MVSNAKVNAAAYFNFFALKQKCFTWSKVFWLATNILLLGIWNISLTYCVYYFCCTNLFFKKRKPFLCGQ